MKAKMSRAQELALSNPSIDFNDIEDFIRREEAKTTGATKMAKNIENNTEIFNGKNVSNIKENIQMTVVNGKLGVLNLVTFDIVPEGTEVEESSFFASVETKSEELKGQLSLVTLGGTVDQLPDTDWFKGEGSFNIDVYPSEMAETISKSINANKGIYKGHTKDDIVRFSYESGVENLPCFSGVLDNTKKAYVELESEIKKFKALTGSVNLEDFMDRYFFKKHILIQGEKGGGKTYSIDKKIRSEKIDSELIIGHEGIEAIDLLGYYVKSDDGNLVWLDGALTKAFRKALTGQVCLFIDEMLRIPSRELNILVGSLTPSSAATYRLRTNRIVNVVDGVGETEMIEIPMANLWCVGTTNVGAGYEVDDIDDALSDRFRVVNKTTSPDELEAILNSYITGKLKKSIVPSLVEFYTQSRDLMVSGEIEKVVNTRHLCEVLQLSNTNDEVKSYMYDLIPTWTSMDTNGQPNKAEKDILTKMIKKIIK